MERVFNLIYYNPHTLQNSKLPNYCIKLGGICLIAQGYQEATRKSVCGNIVFQ